MVCKCRYRERWQGADAEATSWLRRSIETNRNYPVAHFYLAAELAHLGQLDEARAAVQAGPALHSSPTIQTFRANASCIHPAHPSGRERTYATLPQCGGEEK